MRVCLGTNPSPFSSLFSMAFIRFLYAILVTGVFVLIRASKLLAQRLRIHKYDDFLLFFKSYVNSHVQK